MAVAQQLTADSRGHLLILVRTHIGQDRVTVLRWGQNRRHFTDARHGHLQGARNRGRGHGEHVHAGLQRLDVLLVLHAKALLLIHHNEA